MARLSIRPAITGAQGWTTAPMLMAFGEVLARVGTLQLVDSQSAVLGEVHHQPRAGLAGADIA